MGFDSFVVLAAMRTGSNFLESNLNALDGAACLGEAFNPIFVGYPGQDTLLGVSQAERDADPSRLLAAIRAVPRLAGFRYFHDHDPRILTPVLEDRGCAKIVLTRNPLESYVSRKIAAATGQWKLTNVRHAKSDRVAFDAAEFDAHLHELQAFQRQVLSGLQRTGQAAFWLDYEDLRELDVVNGLAAWLGVPARLKSLDRTLKKQNPPSLAEKVTNPAEMAAAVARLDRFDLDRTPSFEPRRGPAVPTYLAAAESPLLFLPLRSGPEAAVADWLTALDGAEPVGGFTHGSLKAWRAGRPGHRSFAVVRHPLARAHTAFAERIAAVGPESFPEIRRHLVGQFGLPLPNDAPPAGADYRAAFTGFLRFLKANLSGQTAMRVDPAWASQAALLAGVAGLAPPDMILREADLERDLPHLAASIGRPDAPPAPRSTDPHAGRLAGIVDDEVEALARAAFARDYLAFGFGDWRGG